ncbi:MAG: DLW-39 family protein [Actinomycetota bacterium]|nr:DLW-39 family protein [Actinomycetota bacterium]
MKKLLALAAAAAGVWAFRRANASRAEADLWAAATDTVEPGH